VPRQEGCSIVAQSPDARIVGVPLSYFGLIFYLYMLGLARLVVFDPHSRGLRLGALLYAALGVSYSIYGMYLHGSPDGNQGTRGRPCEAASRLLAGSSGEVALTGGARSRQRVDSIVREG
jgi:hypothetical protein